MSSPTVILTLNQWEILFHETVAALLRAQEAVKRGFGWWSLSRGLWRSTRDLKILNDGLKAISELPDEVVSEEFIQSQIPQLRKLIGLIEDLIDAGKRHRLMNRSLTSTPLGLIKIRGEYIADYLEALEMSIDPEVLRAINEGRNQIERGEFETMDRLF